LKKEGATHHFETMDMPLARVFITCLLATSVHGASLVQPTVIRATSSSTRSTPTEWNFTMSVEAHYVNNGDIAFWTRAYCYLGECHWPGPTIEVVPGDNVTLTLVNNLGPNPVGEDTTMNSM
jgi:FtsP/CotA-like multicopper oxidase with cupredoxin domain